MWSEIHSAYLNSRKGDLINHVLAVKPLLLRIVCSVSGFLGFATSLLSLELIASDSELLAGVEEALASAAFVLREARAIPPYNSLLCTAFTEANVATQERACIFFQPRRHCSNEGKC